MEQIPEEIFMTILPYLGGISFINLRRTCWRLKTICDTLEMSPRPVLWCRYVFMDFPLPLILLGVPSYPDNDEISWKKYYVRLSTAKDLRHGVDVVKSVLTTKDEYHFVGLVFKDDQLLVKDTQFFLWRLHYKDLLPDSMKCSKDDCKQPDQLVFALPWCRYSLKPKEIRGCCCTSSKGTSEMIVSSNCHQSISSRRDQSASADCHLCAAKRPQSSPREKEQTDKCPHPFDTPYVFDPEFWKYCKWGNHYILHKFTSQHPESPVEIINGCNQKIWTINLGSLHDVRQILFNSNQVVLLCTEKLIIAAIDLESSTLKAVKTIDMKPGDIRKVLMVDNLLILLKGYGGGLQTARIQYHPEDGVCLTNFRHIILNEEGDKYQLLRPEITDIFIHDTIFGALEISGSLYLSILDGCEHESIERNFLPPIKIASECKSMMQKMAATSEHGLKVAVLNQVIKSFAHTAWASKVHILYIRRSK